MTQYSAGLEQRGQSSALDIRASLGGAVYVATLLLVWLTLHPFADLAYTASTELEQPTDVLYHVVAIVLAGMSIAVAFPQLCLALPTLVRVFTVAFALWLLVSVVTSRNVDLSWRRLFVVGMDFTLAAVTLAVPRGVQSFSRLTMIAIGVILVACYAGVLLAPNLSIHQFGDALEGDLAGDWRGAFNHKNTAGPMMGVFVIFGLFSARAGRVVPGVAIAIASAIFLVMTYSKNSIVLLPLVLILAAVAERIRSLWWRGAVCLFPLLMLNVMSVGTVLSDTVKQAVGMLPVDQSFTGRTDIWAFVVERIADRPFTGYGLRAFWHTDTLFASIPHGDEWLASVANSHNGYLDVALMLGLPGLALMIVVFLIYPVIDFHRRIDAPANRMMASLFLRIWMFEMYTSTFESFFFDRAFPGWFTVLVAICGLRYVSRLRVSP